MTTEPVRYRSDEEDSARWIGFPFRQGDIVISTRSKSGTTWMQMICALLVFQTPELPAPLPELSPWLDWLMVPRDEVFASLAAQKHRRFVKTHTPLDGVPSDPRATYVVVARHPLDMAVSLYHQGDNIDRAAVRAKVGMPPPDEPPAPRPPLREWLLAWIDEDAGPRSEPGSIPGSELDSLPGVLWHVSDAWARREESNVRLVHYGALSQDLEREMRRLAAGFGIDVADDLWPSLVRAATFDRMRDHADLTAPDPGGILKDRRAFFRSGVSGAGRAVLTDDEVAHYGERASRLAPADLLAWLHAETFD